MHFEEKALNHLIDSKIGEASLMVAGTRLDSVFNEFKQEVLKNIMVTLEGESGRLTEQLVVD